MEVSRDGGARKLECNTRKRRPGPVLWCCCPGTVGPGRGLRVLGTGAVGVSPFAAPNSRDGGAQSRGVEGWVGNDRSE